jgi:hypothetical protein
MASCCWGYKQALWLQPWQQQEQGDSLEPKGQCRKQQHRVRRGPYNILEPYASPVLPTSSNFDTNEIEMVILFKPLVFPVGY